ncbi:MAG TPA: carboxypeptidase-like regulatory domain-containing protein [Nitrososphaera sp.]|nr:carboxypeptidase-like regulatory domain-containing protein [Nitrososphaera sp.]
MQKFALAALALAIIMVMPAASAQSDSIPVKNALVVLTGQDDSVIQPALAAGGSPSSIRKTLELAKELLSVSAPYAPTDDSGRFTLDAPLNSGAYNVTVFAPGFVTPDAARIAAGSNNVTVFMQPSAMVSGRVTDEQGRPVPGIVVAAKSPHSANYDMTMDDGVFVLDTGLATGAHKIYAFKPGFDTGRLQSLVNDTRLGMLLDSKFPSFFKTQAAGYMSYSSTVDLEQGKLTTLNIQLKSSQSISGRVADENGSPVPDVAVFAFDNNGTMANAAAITDSEGRYILDNDLSAGTYTVIVPSLFSKGYAPASLKTSVPASSADFALRRSSTISGNVVDSSGAAVANATVFAISKSLNLDSTELAEFLAAGAATAKTDGQGKFTMDSGISEGAYAVTASFGNVPVSTSIVVQAGGPVTIALDFSEKVTMTGRVVDGNGKPVESASVVPGFARAIPGAELFAARTGPDGAFLLTVPLRDNSTRSLFSEISVSADGYETVTAPANAGVSVRMEKTPSAKISGVVLAQKSLSPPIETVITRKGTIIFDQEGTKYEVGLQTNSRVLGASFDPPNKRINFELEGAQGAAGRSEFAIPKEFLAGPFVASMDGEVVQPESIRVSENQTHATVELEHEHGLQEITIQGTTAVPEFPLPAALAAAGLAAALLYRRLVRYE